MGLRYRENARRLRAHDDERAAEFYRLRNEFITESSAAYGDADPDEMAALLADARRTR